MLIILHDEIGPSDWPVFALAVEDKGLELAESLVPNSQFSIDQLNSLAGNLVTQGIGK